MKANEDKNIDKLTHKLVREGQPKPAADLSMRIMDRIFRQVPAGMKKIVRVPLLPAISPALLIGMLVVYISSLVGGLYFVNFRLDGLDAFFEEVKEYIPYILTVAFMGISIIGYSLLDDLMTHKKKKSGSL
ncbi:MAG: hypothetical protein LUD02_05590 [Tannerellaceae bacterium]|nr:hypothetical protein [Tannerellaceae bacterium]MCD8263683.1 hypothetical protein [Tannerellaceae bacterium]